MDPLKAKANFTRICHLLIDKGSDALRRALHVIHPAPTLAAALHSHRRTLQRLRYSVINPPQWRLLYPAAGPPNSNDFDITLLTILLRNICGLSSPASGWKVMPPTSDTSISADILRIKMFRNEVYGHTASAQFDDATFEKLWQEISQPLVKLGIPQQEIDELKVAPLSPEEESYVETLMDWKEPEDTLLGRIKDIESQIVDVRTEVKKLKGIESSSNISNLDQLTKFDFKGKIDGLCEKFQEGTRKWFFDELSRWFSDEESRVMILTAGPGIGKSVLSAKVCQDYSESGKLAGGHFSDFRKSNYSKPSNILQSLASQMCDNVDGFRETLAEILGRNHSRDSLSDAFTVLLNEPLHALDRREPMLIVVDALDESKTGDKSEFLDLISDEFPDLPKWIKILITSRPELQVKKKLEHFNPLEILPQDNNQQEDLKCFVKSSLPHLDVGSGVDYLASWCQGSFLYAYYMVKELKDVGAGGEPNLSDFAPRGISGFYERQFKRLRTDLQQHDPGIFNAFINVVAASSGAALPIEILIKCMNLSEEKYEIRNTIINIMSEILPVYNNCLTVYHKSLTDWLTLEGYEVHEFAADVKDGTARLLKVIEGIYRVIDSTESVSNFELSLERKFALDNGGKYVVDLADTADFHWLVNVRLNALKFRFCGDLNVDYNRILNIYKSAPSDELYWSIFQHYYILSGMNLGLVNSDNKSNYVSYLQFLANAHFDFKKNLSSQNTARDILVQENEIWVEDVGNVECRNTEYKLISSTVLSDGFHPSVCSPDKKLLVLTDHRALTVFKLPSLTMIFEMQVNQTFFTPTFSPDSSYFLHGSIRSCVCVRKQKKVAFISDGPEDIKKCSFSSCGKKLVTAEKYFLKVWNVEKRELLVQVEKRYGPFDHYYFSSCNKYILESDRRELIVRDSTTLEEFQKLDQVCYKNSNQIVFLVSDWIGDTICYHLSAHEVAVITPTKSLFTWRNRRCQILSCSSTLTIYDFINREVIDRFLIDCLPATTLINCTSKLDGTNFLLSLDVRNMVVLSLETPEESSVVPYAFPLASFKVTLSPDHLYVACYYEDGFFTIRSVDNGETLETVELQKPPESCWWSELYLWVICEGALVRFPYYSTHSEVLGRGGEVFPLTFGRVLGFGEGVFVFKESNNMIHILKIFDNMPFIQKIGDPPFSDAAISKDGCAVLLYHTDTEENTTCLQYRLLEFTPESGWELHLYETTGIKFHKIMLKLLSLTGTQNCRSSMWVGFDMASANSILSFYNFSSKELDECSLPYTTFDYFRVFDVAPNFLLMADNWLSVLNASDNKIIARLPLCECKYDSEDSSDIFYLPSKDLLLVVFGNDIKYFKIHNLKSHNRFLTPREVCHAK